MAELLSLEIGDKPGLEITNQDHDLANGPLQEPNVGGTHLLRNENSDNQDDFGLSGGILRYIDQILMHEGMDSEMRMLQDSMALQEKERCLYEVLGKPYPAQEESDLHGQCDERPNKNHGYFNLVNPAIGNDCSGHLIDAGDQSRPNTHPDNNKYFASHIDSTSSISLSNCLDIVMNRSCSESRVVWDFSTGSSRFLPTASLLVQNPKEGEDKVENNEPKIKGPCLPPSLHKKKKTRSNTKSSLFCLESNDPSDKFSDVLHHTLDRREDELAAYMANLQISTIKSVDLVNAEKEAKGSSGVNKKKKEVIDMTSLLTKCAEFVAEGDHQVANNLLKQIRQHSSPYGDPTRRVAHYFADGLEARLAGRGSETYKSLLGEGQERASNYLIAYCLSALYFPFQRLSSFATDNMILSKSRKATRLHIIDFGIPLGFHWPSFIRRLARRDSNPATMLRITGVDFPLSGQGPEERVEEMGRWLARHAEKHGVPFEYNGVARKWEDLEIGNFRLRKDEFVVVHLLDRARNLSEGTDTAEKSKNMVVDLIRKVNPGLVINRVINGVVKNQFFIPRFREAVSQYSHLFDLLRAIWQGDEPERLLVERDLLGKQIFNVVACEGWETVERADTYKQWQNRIVRANFAQVPFGVELKAAMMDEVRRSYHRDFLVDEDNHWLLLSWKGRIIYAVSIWQPVTG